MSEFTNEIITRLKKEGYGGQQLTGKTITRVMQMIDEVGFENLQKKIEAEYLCDLANKAEEIIQKVHAEAIDTSSDLFLKRNRLEEGLQRFEQINDELSQLDTTCRRLDAYVVILKNNLKSLDEDQKNIRNALGASKLTNEKEIQTLIKYREMLEISKEVFGEDKLTPEVISSILQCASYAVWRSLDPKQEDGYKGGRNGRYMFE